MNALTGFAPALHRQVDISNRLSRPPFAPTPPAPVTLIWWCFVGCLILGNIGAVFADVGGPLAVVIAFGGSAGCAWAWLLTRALFRAETSPPGWAFCLLGATIVFEGVWALTDGLSTTGAGHRIIANGASFLCVALLAMVFVEALSGFAQIADAKERRFRQVYVGLFGAMLAITMIWALGAPEGSLAARSEIPTRLAFAALAIIGGRFALNFRRNHPVTGTNDATCQPTARTVARTVAPDATCTQLAGRIRSALEDDQLFATPQLKVADLSAALGEPDYKVTQCITSVMGYSNFNRLVNEYRINAAKTALRDTENMDRQILTIALECGFNSIGPFNRAFKEEVGMTPRAYRAGKNSRANPTAPVALP